jgi:hypothetical protein
MSFKMKHTKNLTQFFLLSSHSHPHMYLLDHCHILRVKHVRCLIHYHPKESHLTIHFPHWINNILEIIFYNDMI